MIRISDLTVRFGGVLALDGIRLGIDDDVVGIIGPNGAGKTTLVNVFSGFVSPVRGRVTVDDVDLLAAPPYRRARWGLARSFQKVQTVDDLTVEDNIRVALDPHPWPASEKHDAIATVLAFTGLGALAHVDGGDLDPFQRRMTEIARCLVPRPRIILLDEPGGGLSDAEMRFLRRTIAGIPGQFGAQVLLIDHDVELIRATCSKTAVLDFGKLIAFGPTEAVLRDPRVKAAYLGVETTE